MKTTNYVGQIHKSAIIRCSDPKTPQTKIEIKGVVKGIGCRPSKRAYFFTSQGEENVKEFTIYTVGEKQITINAESENPFVAVTLERLNNNAPTRPTEAWYQYKLIARLMSNAPPGRLSGRIKVTTSSELTPQLEIMITGEVSSNIAVEPGTVHLWVKNENTKSTGIFRIKQRNSKPFQILKTETSNRLLVLDLEEKTPGTYYLAKVEWHDPKILSQQTENIIITTNDDLTPQIKVNVIIHPQR